MSYQTILRFTIMFILIAGHSFAFARWQATVTWQIGPGPGTYKGIGESQGEAFLAAQNLCYQAQPLDDWKAYCLNAPAKTEYTALPGGSYIESCGNCRPENNKLVCDWCKPVLERRELDLSTCPASRLDHIQNCGGDLNCTTGC